ncbi:MAG TPA: HDOD domain-containing protein [Gammaproteobacteria bacterium]|nr:HDOD domain-containing protein [Gammaproteobacteria bacterium]
MVPSSPINLEQLNFPKVSPQAAKVLNYLSSEDPDMGEVDNIIMRDPVLAGTLLRYANSPLYRSSGEISNIPTATRMIGIKNVRSAAVMTALRATCPAESELTKTILQHSLGIATLCKLIAKKSCPAVADDLELLGLIHDIGMVVLACNAENEYRALLARAQAENIAVDKLEKMEFGFTHDQIAARALHEFRLPKRHETVLTHFHQPPDENETDEELKKERAVLVLAHRLLFEIRGDDVCSETLFESTDELMHILNLDDAAVETVLEYARAHLSDFAG